MNYSIVQCSSSYAIAFHFHVIVVALLVILAFIVAASYPSG